MSEFKNDDMSIKEYVVMAIVKQGLPFLLLLIMSWYFYDQNSKLEKKIDDCNMNTIAIYSLKSDTLLRIMAESNQVMTETLDYLKYKKK